MLKLVDLLTEKKLRVFDFDDTLVKSNSKVYVMNKGKRKTLTPGQFAIYKKKSGDEFDFSDFDKVIEPKQIKSMFRVFNNIYKASGIRRFKSTEEGRLDSKSNTERI